MEDDQNFHRSGATAAQSAAVFVSFSPFAPSISPSPRRLSSCFSERSRPVHAARRLSWVSLQGRLVGAEEASSARTIKGGLKKEEAVAWELFSPIHRILIVAVVAVAVADLKKSKLIWKLRRSVELRDQVLLSMQQKLDDLCEQVNVMKDQPDIKSDMSFAKNEGNILEQTKFYNCGCRLCAQHGISSNGLMESFVEKTCDGDEMFKFKMPLTIASEQEERRMSDLSDLASSVTSAADIHLNTLAIEQDIYNLQRESKEKDATIMELTSAIRASGSKRVAELEDIIRRKNMVITKMKKDMFILEQKVVHLTRLRRPSFSSSTPSSRPLPVMADNLLYDMSSTSPSSSDSDCPTENRSWDSFSNEDKHIPTQRHDLTAKRNQRPTSTKASITLPRPTDSHPKTRPVTPLKEKSMNQRLDRTMALRPKQSVPAGGETKRNRRRTQPGSKDTPQRKWV